MRKKTVTIIGNTSSFHLGSSTNYSEFRKLVCSKYQIIQEIPYNSFHLDFQDYFSFKDELENSQWIQGLKESDILVVHGEGLTEKCEPFVFPFMYFSRIAKAMGSQSQLVNFSMFDIEPFLPFLKDFDYLAPREIITQDKLKQHRLESTLAFDCCILSRNDILQGQGDGHIAAIRGRAPFSPEKLVNRNKKTKRYDCCWSWEKSLEFSSLDDYLNEISKADFAFSSSFHANIFSFLAGVPFVTVSEDNLKYRALETELFPKGLSFNARRLPSITETHEIKEYYKQIFSKILERARRNVI